MSDDEKALAEKREAFLAKIPDPPENPLVAAEHAHAEAEASDDSPKVASASRAHTKTASKTSSVRTAEPETTASPGTSESKTAGGDDAPVADRIVAALKAGDLDLVADLTDQDPADFDEKSTKWAARNRKEQKLKAEVAQVKADAAAVLEHWEPIDTRAAEFHRTKNYVLVKELVELLTGEDFDSAAMKTFRAVRNQDPRVPELTKALEAKDSELTEHRSAKEKAADRALREALRDDLPEDHQVRKLPDWEDKVAAVLRESVDEDTGEPALSFKQAAQRVVRTAKEAYQKYADVFAEPAQRSRRAAEPATPERARGAAPATKRPKSRDEFFAQFK